jgi:ring-opening amidohydrolase-like protein
MAIEVAKVELKSVSDAGGMEERIETGQFTADQVIAVIGKTEGNGGVNDFTRILADQAFRRVLMKHGTRSEAAVGKIPMVWSGGCDGVITPHATVFARNDRKGPASKSRLTIGTAMSATLLPEDIGRLTMVEKVAEAVRAAMRNAGISDPADVHYVQTKTPLLTIESVRQAEGRHQTVSCEVHDSMGTEPPRSALRSRSPRLRCRTPSRSAGISIYIRRSLPVPRASSSTRRRSCCSATRREPAAGFASGTQ